MDPIAAKIEPGRIHITVECAARPDSNSPLAGESFSTSRRVENLISEYSRMIKGAAGKFGRCYPQIGKDSFEQAAWVGIFSACRRPDSAILKATGTDETNLMYVIIERACINELRKENKTQKILSFWAGDATLLDSLDANCDRRLSTSSKAVDENEFSSTRERLEAKGIILTDRQLAILNLKFSADENGQKLTYAQIGSELGISDVTVKREMSEIRQLGLQSRSSVGSEATNVKYSKSAQTREEYLALLKEPEKWKLNDRKIQFLEVYLELSSNGKPVSETKIAERLGISVSAMQSMRRRLYDMKPAAVLGSGAA